ncbi:RagB/SusD family nutrient uptake outer membrane protein [Chitinophaga caseinilytica]|uniref:RagB/SusD family nutrient uptake outer membrane protein n=1 Tax=Chitinophaga caseinilytica TaxID=2267521 RepID=UPI003C307134
MRKNIQTWIVAALLLVSFPSCKKYLDVMPDNVATIDYAFRNRNEAENYLFTCYATMQRNLFYTWNDPAFTMGGEIIHPILQEGGGGDFGFRALRSGKNVMSVEFDLFNGSNGGVKLYQAIRRCNIFLDNVDKPIDLTPTEKARWTAEAKFLKAYYNYWLVRQYGPVPLIRKNLPLNASVEDVRVKREHVDTVFNYIVQLLDEAVPGLPPVITSAASESGRITKAAALSLKAEALTWQASPLFNGNPDYTSFRTKEGQTLFPEKFDPGKWTRAAAACKEAVEAAHDAGIKLYNFVPPANLSNISDSTMKLLAFQGTVSHLFNDEVIWGANPVHADFQYYCVPKMTPESQANDIIFGSLCAPLAIAELFYTENGVPINEDKTWDYANRNTPRASDDAHKYYIHNGYQTAGLNLHREMRFYASLGFDGSNWFGNGTLDDENQQYIQGKMKQVSGAAMAIKTNATGYWIKKLVSYQSEFQRQSLPVAFAVPRIRLAAMYLLYAEALNEAGNQAEALVWINKVRERAGLKTVQESWSTYSSQPGKFNTKDGLRQIIHQERRIELAFESQVGWDMRRWKEMKDYFSSPIQGWSVYEESVAGYYRRRTIFMPVYSTKEYLWPISDNDLTVNPNLVQTPLW